MNSNGLVKNGFTLNSICRYICSDISTHNTRWASRLPWWTPAWRAAVRHFENEKKCPGLKVRFPMTCDLMSWHYIIDISIKEVEHSEKIHESSTIFDPDELKLKIIFKVVFHTQHTLRRLAWSNSGIVNDSNTTFDFIIEKMNQVSCPIWAHLVNLTLQINAL